MYALGDYKPLKFLATGAQGSCSLYENVKDFQKRKVVIKKITLKLSELDQEECKKQREKIMIEAEILRKCRHPFIIGFYEYFCKVEKEEFSNRFNENLYIVMAYAAGGSLRDEIERRNKYNHFMTDNEVLHYFTQITLALHYLHSQKVIHCDLKPENILLNESKKLAKLADFGISLLASDKAVGKFGTSFYMAPEIHNGQAYTEKVDVWALGCVLYEMCELDIPFKCHLAAVDMLVMKGEYTPPSHIANSEILGILKDCMDVNPRNRPSIGDLLRHPLIVLATAKIMCMVEL